MPISTASVELCCATSDILVGNKAWRGVLTDHDTAVLEELLPVRGWPMDETMPSPVLSNDTDPTKLVIGNRPNVAADRLAWALVPPTPVLVMITLVRALSPWLPELGRREADTWTVCCCCTVSWSAWICCCCCRRVAEMLALTELAMFSVADG